MNNLKILHNYAYWGPLLWFSKISLDACDELIVRGKKLTSPLNKSLASVIDDVKEFSTRDDRKFIVDILQPYLQVYMEFAKEWYNKKETTTPELELTKVWINVQKAYEFNPEHTHGGDLSFVIYLDIPDAIRIENDAYVGTSAGPGAINFRYGEDNDWACSTQSFLPEKGEIFIFPAKLSHSVIPFKSNVERISIAGNFKFIHD
jgi:hypothetical protein